MILFRSHLSELIGPFLMTLGVTSFILMMGKIYNIITLMVEQNMAFVEGAMMFAYVVPQSVTVMLPIGVMGAVMITVMRQSMDSELIALRASGQSLWRYALPVVVFGVAGVAITAVMTLWVQPTANRRFLDFQVEMIRAHAEDSLIPGELNFDFADKVIRIGERLPDRRVRDVFLADQVLSEGSPVVVAEEGRIVVDTATRRVVFRLHNGEMLAHGDKPEAFNATRFDTLDYVLEMGGRERIDTREVELRWTFSTAELLERIAREEPGSKEMNRLLIELHTRLSTPFACLALALAALPLSIVNPRFRRTGGMLKGVTLVLGFYILWIGCRNLVLGLLAPPEILWLPALAVALFGLWRTSAANRHAG